jgi:hypothetical protein
MSDAMENENPIDAVQNNGDNQNTVDSAAVNKKELNQIQNKYDSHSEEKPQQKTIIAEDSKADRVSHDTRDTTTDEAATDDDLDDDGSEDDDFENQTKPFPKSNSSSFPSIS